jgi:hypothetical protein
MAQKLREAYQLLFGANEYAWKLGKTELQSKLRSLTGAGEDDKNIPAVTNTFLELSKLAKWDKTQDIPKKDTLKKEDDLQKEKNEPRTGDFLSSGLGLSYTINLNLPATTEIEVFNAIFKSLRDNLLRS